MKGRPSVLYRNHIIPLVYSSNAVSPCIHKAYGNFGRGVLYRNFVGQGCYKETIYSLLDVKESKMPKFMLNLASVFISLFTSIVVMIKGWGIEPKSWFWIIGVYLVGQILAVGFVLVSKDV